MSRRNPGPRPYTIQGYWEGRTTCPHPEACHENRHFTWALAPKGERPEAIAAYWIGMSVAAGHPRGIEVIEGPFLRAYKIADGAGERWVVFGEYHHAEALQ